MQVPQKLSQGNERRGSRYRHRAAILPSKRNDVLWADAGSRLEVIGPQVDDIARTQADLLQHIGEWKPAFEARLEQAEIRFLHRVRELEALNRDREESFTASLRQVHADYLQSLDSAISELQQKFWADIQKVEADHERQIHAELRVLPSHNDAVRASLQHGAASHHAVQHSVARRACTQRWQRHASTILCSRTARRGRVRPAAARGGTAQISGAARGVYGRHVA